MSTPRNEAAEWSFETLLRAVEDARREYAEAVDMQRSADRAQTAALNHVNEAETALRAAITKLQHDSPPDSAWARERLSARVDVVVRGGTVQSLNSQVITT